MLAIIFMIMTQSSLEVRVAAAAPVLANAALLVAEGCIYKYADAITTLYLANNLPCPDMQPVINMKLGMCEIAQQSTFTLSSEANILPDQYENQEEYSDSDYFNASIVPSNSIEDDKDDLNDSVVPQVEDVGSPTGSLHGVFP